MRSPIQTTPGSKHNSPVCDVAHIDIPRLLANTLLSFVVCKLTIANMISRYKDTLPLLERVLHSKRGISLGINSMQIYSVNTRL